MEVGRQGQDAAAARRREQLQRRGETHHRKDHEEDLHLAVDNEKGTIRVMSIADHKKELAVRQRRELADRLLTQARELKKARPSLNPRDFNMADSRLPEKTAEAEDFENEEMLRMYGKRGRDEHSDEELIDGPAKTKTGGEDGAKPTAATVRDRERILAVRERKRRRLEDDIKTGEEFASVHGSGDIKRGNVDPFAYVPLNRAMLNKRNANLRLKRYEAVSTKNKKGGKARMEQLAKERATAQGQKKLAFRKKR
jgi:ribosomal RNA-processing protein 12